MDGRLNVLFIWHKTGLITLICFEDKSGLKSLMVCFDSPTKLLLVIFFLVLSDILIAYPYDEIFLNSILVSLMNYTKTLIVNIEMQIRLIMFCLLFSMHFSFSINGKNMFQ